MATKTTKPPTTQTQQPSSPAPKESATPTSAEPSLPSTLKFRPLSAQEEHDLENEEPTAP